MFRFEMSRAGSVTEKQRARERKVETKQGRGGGLQRVDERDIHVFFPLSPSCRLLEQDKRNINCSNKKTKKLNGVTVSSCASVSLPRHPALCDDLPSFTLL